MPSYQSMPSPQQDVFPESDSRVCAQYTDSQAQQTAPTAANLQPYGNAAAQQVLPAAAPREPTDVVAYDVNANLVITTGESLQEIGGAQGAPFADFAGMVGSILANAAGRPIGKLVIMAHAYPGEMVLGQGANARGIWPEDVQKNSAELSRLAGHFAPTGYVEVHGCNFGQDWRGEEFISELSQIWGVPVTAGREAQLATTPWMDGTTVTASPDGKGGTNLTEDKHPIGDAVIHGCEDFADGEDYVAKEVGNLWNWVFGEES